MNVMTGLMASVSPLAGAIELEHLSADRVQVLCGLSGDEPFFAGHYPSSAILPGVLLMDITDQAMRYYVSAYHPDGAMLTGLKSLKFFAPVIPPGKVRVDCAVKRFEDILHVTARASDERRECARMRLRYTVTR